MGFVVPGLDAMGLRSVRVGDLDLVAREVFLLRSRPGAEEQRVAPPRPGRAERHAGRVAEREVIAGIRPGALRLVGVGVSNLEPYRQLVLT